MLHLVCPTCDQLVRILDESDLCCPWCRMTEGEEVTLVPLPEPLLEIEWVLENEPIRSARPR